ncbi:hypothetical protein Tco_0241228 [Tanacetum coccineum]
METKDTLSSCLYSDEQDMQQMVKRAKILKDSCLNGLSVLKSNFTRKHEQGITKSEFEPAFSHIFGEDVDTFTRTFSQNMDTLEQQLTKETILESNCQNAFRVLKTQFEKIFTSVLIKPSSLDAHHKREYDSWVNERQIHTTEEKVDTSKALDASLVNIASSGTESVEQNTNSRSGNDAHADDADIRPIYDEEPMAEVQTTAEINVFATRQQHTEQPEFNNEGEVDHNAEQYVIETITIELEHKVAKLLKENKTLKRHYKELSDSIKTTRAKTIEHTTSLIARNAEFKAQLQERGFAIATLKNELRKLTRNSVNTKFAKSSILGKPVLQPRRNQSVVRQLTAFKSEQPRISKPRFTSQVDVNSDLSKPVTTHYLPKEREFAVVKPHHVIASSESRNSSKNILIFSSNDMVHNHYLEEAKKKTQERVRNSRPSVMPSAKSQSTTNGSKPKPMSNTQTSRNWPASKNINSRAKVPSNKTTKRYKPIEKISVAKKPERHMPKGHRFSIKKTSVVHEKIMTPRSCLRWKPMGKIFKSIGLRWVPIGKIFTSSTTKVDSEPSNGSNEDITNQYECEQTLDISAGTLNLSAGTSFNSKKEGLRVWLLKRLISQKLGLQGILI